MNQIRKNKCLYLAITVITHTGMRKPLVFLLILASFNEADAMDRTRQSFDFDWQFHPGKFTEAVL